MSGAGERRVATVAIVVRDYEEAIAWYRDKLGFVLEEDADLGDGKRWVTMAPSRSSGHGARLLMARAVGTEQSSRIGNQTGGRVFLFLETDDFRRDYQAMLARGVNFREEPRVEPYGTVAVFSDLYGNLWDLLESAKPS